MALLNLRSVGHGDLFQQLEDLVCELNRKEVQVQFWQVPKEQNSAATRLAQAPLDGVENIDTGERFDDGLPDEYVEVD